MTRCLNRLIRTFRAFNTDICFWGNSPDLPWALPILTRQNRLNGCAYYFANYGRGCTGCDDSGAGRSFLAASPPQADRHECHDRSRPVLSCCPANIDPAATPPVEIGKKVSRRSISTSESYLASRTDSFRHRAITSIALVEQGCSWCVIRILFINSFKCDSRPCFFLPMFSTRNHSSRIFCDGVHRAPD